jgi:hypothetical protein
MYAHRELAAQILNDILTVGLTWKSIMSDSLHVEIITLVDLTHSGANLRWNLWLP